MTGVHGVGLWMFGIAVLFIVYQLAVRGAQCHYCGKVNTHEEHCPYAGSGL